MPLAGRRRDVEGHLDTGAQQPERVDGCPHVVVDPFKVDEDAELEAPLPTLRRHRGDRHTGPKIDRPRVVGVEKICVDALENPLQTQANIEEQSSPQCCMQTAPWPDIDNDDVVLEAGHRGCLLCVLLLVEFDQKQLRLVLGDRDVPTTQAELVQHNSLDLLGPRGRRRANGHHHMCRALPLLDLLLEVEGGGHEVRGLVRPIGGVADPRHLAGAREAPDGVTACTRSVGC
ncbi:hypothetical protein PVAP13_6KG023032 [Panicum virgatum]|uniref:Uncharacterized protein n=1 Tax=Panicum virgatum TaxID=38727 RepID=A0A8T0R881_PANVG|nr:hypothetical protein PVAP13_6KG023032 [Panicum virgatum]